MDAANHPPDRASACDALFDQIERELAALLHAPLPHAPQLHTPLDGTAMAGPCNRRATDG